MSAPEESMNPSFPQVGEFSHEVFAYRGEEEFVEGTESFLREGIEAGERLLAVLSPPKIGLLRERLGPDAAAVQFADMAKVGLNPARIIPVWRAFVDDRPVGPSGPICGLRGIGEPIWAARSPAELVECQQHESLLNQAFGATPGFRLLCPYDQDLGPDILGEAMRSHPFLFSAGNLQRSTGWDIAGAEARPFETPLPSPAAGHEEITFRMGQLRQVRAFVGRHAAAAGLDPETTADLVLAVNEVATNSLRYGGAEGSLRAWREGPTLICEIRDLGWIADPMVGRRRPDPTDIGGFGLWLVNHLCDLVQVRTGPGGSVVRLHIRSEVA